MITNNARPGVYSQYDVSTLYAASRSGSCAAVVAKAAGGTADEPVFYTSYAKAAEVYAADPAMLGALRILFRCGVSRVAAVPVQGEDYGAALEAAAALENIGAVVCDCTETPDLMLLKASVRAASDALRERVGYCGIADPEAAVSAAKALDSERMVVCCPGSLPLDGAGTASAFFTAAAVAGTVLAADDPVHNFSGEALTCIAPPERLPEAQVQELLAAGVTVVEPVGEQVQIVRVLTAKTASDRALGGLNTVLVIDNVMQSVRAALRTRLRGSRITAQSRDSILSQVVVELSGKQGEGVIESFETPRVYADESDPAVCIVELSFTVAHVLSQIHVVAHIQA